MEAQSGRDTQGGREGGKRVTRGVLYKKEGSFCPKRQSFGSGRSRCLSSKGDGLQLCRTELLRINQTIIHDSR